MCEHDEPQCAMKTWTTRSCGAAGGLCPPASLTSPGSPRTDGNRHGSAEAEPDLRRPGGEGRNRTGDTTVFSRVLYQLSYLAAADSVAVALP